SKSSTSSAPPSLQTKQIRHCEFTRLLCCPRRSPTSRSERSDRTISITERVNNATREIGTPRRRRLASGSPYLPVELLLAPLFQPWTRPQQGHQRIQFRHG